MKRETGLQSGLKRSKLKIRAFYDDTDFRLKSWRKIRKLIEKVICEENYLPGDLNYIFTTDSLLIEINKEFLKHNYYTDVISFRYNSGVDISGEVYISVDTVKENAKNYKVSYSEEVLRVIIHGTLHLCGYEDGTGEKRGIMKVKEDLWIRYFRERKHEL